MSQKPLYEAARAHSARSWRRIPDLVRVLPQMAWMILLLGGGFTGIPLRRESLASIAATASSTASSRSGADVKGRAGRPRRDFSL